VLSPCNTFTKIAEGKLRLPARPNVPFGTGGEAHNIGKGLVVSMSNHGPWKENRRFAFHALCPLLPARQVCNLL